MQRNVAWNGRKPPKYTEPKSKQVALPMGHALTDVGRLELEEIRREEKARNAARVGNATQNIIHVPHTAPPEHATQNRIHVPHTARTDHATQHRIHVPHTARSDRPGPVDPEIGHASTDTRRMVHAKIRREEAERNAARTQISGVRTDSHHAASSHKLFVCESCRSEMRNRDSSVPLPRPESALPDSLTGVMRRLSF